MGQKKCDKCKHGFEAKRVQKYPIGIKAFWNGWAQHVHGGKRDGDTQEVTVVAWEDRGAFPYAISRKDGHTFWVDEECLAPVLSYTRKFSKNDSVMWREVPATVVGFSEPVGLRGNADNDVLYLIRLCGEHTDKIVGEDALTTLFQLHDIVTVTHPKYKTVAKIVKLFSTFAKLSSGLTWRFDMLRHATDEEVREYGKKAAPKPKLKIEGITMTNPWNFTAKQYSEAVRMSLEHHEDGAHRTKETYGDFKMGTEFCALCQMFDGGEECDMCPLADDGGGCTPEYFEAENAQNAHDFPAFHDAEVALCDRIRNLPDYYHWFAQKAKGMVRKFEGKKYRYTGDERAPKKGEVYQNPYYADKLCTCGVKCSPLLRHILEPVDEGKGEGKSDTSVGAGISRSFDIRRDTYIPKYKQAFPNCLTCAHDYAPKQAKPKYAVGEHVWWNGEGLKDEQAQEVVVKASNNSTVPYYITYGNDECCWVFASTLSPLPAKPKFKIGDIVATIPGGFHCGVQGAVYNGHTVEEVICTSPFKTLYSGGTETTVWGADRYRLATDDEALAYWLAKATVKRNGVLVRAFKNRDGVTGVYWNDGGEKDWAWGKGLHKIIDPDLPVIPYKFNKGKYPYPEKGE